MAKAYLDSCIVILAVESPDASGKSILEKLYPANGDSPKMFISDLTKLECLVAPIREGNDDSIRGFHDFFDHLETFTVNPTSGVFEKATRIRARTGVATPDALHIAFALEAGCDEFWTNDLRLQRAAADSIQMVVPMGNE